MILNNSMSLSNNGQNPIGDMRKNNPTKTEVALTVSATIAAINLRKLQHEYDRIASQNDIESLVHTFPRQKLKSDFRNFRECEKVGSSE